MPKRILFIDYIRFVACFLVMLVHSSENFYCYTADTSMLANVAPLFMPDGPANPILPIYLTIAALKRCHEFNEMLNKCFDYAYDADKG